MRLTGNHVIVYAPGGHLEKYIKPKNDNDIYIGIMLHIKVAPADMVRR